ncbi:MAG: class I SAM-dependent methyltransferase [Elusimicrobiota bacterium]|jgi:hypothetical protein
MDIRGFVLSARAHGDAREDTYEHLAYHFCEAHRHAPGGVSVEVGTRRGGSAFMQLKLLQELYPPILHPLLVTIDPYGDKPYLTGLVGAPPIAGLYGNADYLEAKQLLASFPRHVHFSITSLDWLVFAKAGLRLWYHGAPLEPGARNITHVYLDGDHDAPTILGEVEGFVPMLKPGGRITIDNTPDDPKTIPGLELLVLQSKVGLSLLRPLADMAVIVRCK